MKPITNGPAQRSRETAPAPVHQADHGSRGQPEGAGLKRPASVAASQTCYVVFDLAGPILSVIPDGMSIGQMDPALLLAGAAVSGAGGVQWLKLWLRITTLRER